MKTQLSPQNVQQLSAYLDGQMSQREKERLEQILRSRPDLQTALIELRRTRAMLRCLPRRKVPHHFTLTRAMAAESRRRRSPWSSVLGVTSILTAVMSIFLFMLRLLPMGAMAPAPMAQAPMEVAVEMAKEVEVQSTPMIIEWQPTVGQGIGGGAAEPSVLAVEKAPSADVVQEPQVMEEPQPTLAAEVGAPEATQSPAEMPAPTATLGAEMRVMVEETPVAEENLSEGEEKALADESQPLILGIRPTEEQGLMLLPTGETPLREAKRPVDAFLLVQIVLLSMVLAAGAGAIILRRKR